MSTPLIEGIRGQRPGTLQNQLKAQALELGADKGGLLINAALAAGDHTAGLVFAMEKIFDIDPNAAMPLLGRTSKIAREGVTVNDDLQVVKAKMDPRFISKN